MHWVTYKRHLLLQMTAGRNECNGKQSGRVFALSPQQTRTVSSQILRPCRTFLLANDGASATTLDDPGPSPQHSDMDLNLDVSMSLTDSNADAEGVTDDEVLAPSPTRSAPHPLLRSSCRHEHPDGPMLGFVVPEREVADANTSTSLDQARASPDRCFDFDLTSLTSLNPNVSDGEGWSTGPRSTILVVRASARALVLACTLVTGRSTVLGGVGQYQPSQGRRLLELAC